MEGLFIMMVFLALAFGIVEFGSIIHAQTTVTHIAREGGNLASRDYNAGEDLLDLLVSSSSSLDFSQNPGSYKMYLLSVDAGDATNNNPTCATISQRGTLAGSHVVSPQTELHCGLTPELATYLTHDGTSVPIDRLTIVKVYYHHHPMTPLGGVLAASMFGGSRHENGDIILTSKSIF
ncbi:MAG: pilus assembly protein [Nitrospira sp.]|nr:pilus assembly protein [Nitrospira sp.]